VTYTPIINVILYAYTIFYIIIIYSFRYTFLNIVPRAFEVLYIYNIGIQGEPEVRTCTACRQNIFRTLKVYVTHNTDDDDDDDEDDENENDNNTCIEVYLRVSSRQRAYKLYYNMVVKNYTTQPLLPI